MTDVNGGGLRVNFFIDDKNKAERSPKFLLNIPVSLMDQPVGLGCENYFKGVLGNEFHFHRVLTLCQHKARHTIF